MNICFRPKIELKIYKIVLKLTRKVNLLSVLTINELTSSLVYYILLYFVRTYVCMTVGTHELVSPEHAGLSAERNVRSGYRVHVQFGDSYVYQVNSVFRRFFVPLRTSDGQVFGFYISVDQLAVVHVFDSGYLWNAKRLLILVIYQASRYSYIIMSSVRSYKLVRYIYKHLYTYRTVFPNSWGGEEGGVNTFPGRRKQSSLGKIFILHKLEKNR